MKAWYTKLKTYKDGAYDLVVPSTYFISKMSHEGMLKKIDKSKLTHFDNLDPSLLHKSFDPKMTTPFLIFGVRPLLVLIVMKLM